MPSRRVFKERILREAQQQVNGSVLNLTTSFAALGAHTPVVAGDSFPVLTAAGTARRSLASTLRTYVLGISGGTATIPENLTTNGQLVVGANNWGSSAAIVKDSASFGLDLIRYAGASNVTLARSNGASYAARTAVVLNDPIGFVAYGGYDGTSLVGVNPVQLIATATENWSATNRGTEWKVRNTLTGTASARDALVVRGDGAIAQYNNFSDMYAVLFNNSFDVVRNTNTAADFPAFSLVRTRGTFGAETSVQSGDQLGQFQMSGQGGSSLFVASVIQSFATENWSGAASGSDMRFRVTGNGDVVPTTVLTLTSSAMQTNGTAGIGAVPQTFAGVLAGASLSGSTTQRVFQASGVFGTGTTSFAQGVRVVPTFASGSYTTPNYAGLYVGTVAAGGGGHVITNAHGLYIEAQTAGGTLNRAITTLGGTHWFGGAVTISGDLDLSSNQALNFCIENRTSDPGSPSTGRLWLRTDL